MGGGGHGPPSDPGETALLVSIRNIQLKASRHAISTSMLSQNLEHPPPCPSRWPGAPSAKIRLEAPLHVAFQRASIVGQLCDMKRTLTLEGLSQRGNLAGFGLPRAGVGDGMVLHW